MTKLTEAAIKKMTISQLKKAAEDLFEADDLKGLKKAELQKLLIDAQSEPAPEPEEDDEVDDDEELDDIDDLDEADEELDEIDEPAEDPIAKAKVKRTAIAKAKQENVKADTPPEPNGDTLTAKQVATRIGTDAKTLRKFFRSADSTTEAVGQGGRYEFAKEDLPKIKSEFDKWNSGKTHRAPRAAGETAKAEPKGRMAAASDEIEEVDDELDDEPTDDDLELEDDLELDDDDLELDE